MCIHIHICQHKLCMPNYVWIINSNAGKLTHQSQKPVCAFCPTVTTRNVKMHKFRAPSGKIPLNIFLDVKSLASNESANKKYKFIIVCEKTEHIQKDLLKDLDRDRVINMNYWFVISLCHTHGSSSQHFCFFRQHITYGLICSQFFISYSFPNNFQTSGIC